MELFNTRYFVINKLFLSATGLWPYVDRKKKNLIRGSYVIFLVMMGVPQFIGIHKDWGVDADRFFEHIGVLCYTIAVLLKLMVSVFAEEKFMGLYTDIVHNWNLITYESEKKLLVKYSEQGRNMTIGYAAYMVSGLLCFIALPMTPRLLDWIKPLDHPRPYSFVLNGDYLVDRYERYAEIYAFDSISSAYTAIILVSVDPMYVTFVLHILGILSIVKERIRQTNERMHQQDQFKLNEQDPSYEWIVKTVELHQKVLKFVVNLESCYSRLFLLTMGLNIVYISFSCVIIVSSKSTITVIRYSMLLLCQTIHLFYLSWPGQMLIDSSSDLLRDTYVNEWYHCSRNSKILLKFFALRSSKPLILTAGGLYVLSLTNFLSVMKTSLSYITVITSMT